VKRSRLEIARAVLRLSGEQLIPIERLCEQAMASTRSIIRWIVEGRGGVHLDGYHKDGVGWVSSVAALERFFKEVLATSRKADDDELTRLRTDGAA
jgi:hypothetical protein